ncbi:MAG: site-specific DNA-methyltransferase [Anaerolineae bacterium]|nr:site-specific DNA-methyltransferase [Anaerolineae bacterium]
MNQVYAHSCEEMPELSDNSVALTVTSPPYWNAIDYDIHASNKRQHYRTRAYSNGYSKYSDYLDWLERIFAEVLRVTKPGGFCAIVIGTVLFDGKHYPVPFDVVSRLSQKGWDFHQDIIWHKCTAGVKRAGVMIQKPYPGYFYPNIMTEYILVFRKPGSPIYQNRSAEQRAEAEVPINRLFTMDIANNIWHIAPVPPDLLDHPCPFPEEIPYRLITMYSYPGEIVLDPFLGSGQTTKVARWLNRLYVGYETIPKYVDLARKRLAEPLSIRPQQLIAVFEKVGLNDSSNEAYLKHSVNKSRARRTRPGYLETASPKGDVVIQPQLLEKGPDYID